MIIKRVTNGSSKSVALGQPRGIHKEGNSVIFTVEHIDTSNATLWRVQISEEELQRLFDKITA